MYSEVTTEQVKVIVAIDEKTIDIPSKEFVTMVQEFHEKLSERIRQVGTEGPKVKGMYA